MLGFAKTQKGAQYRVKMKRALKKKGVAYHPKDTTQSLEKKYRKHIGTISRPR